MKSGGFKSRGGGLKRRAPSDVPTGISRTRDGSLRARDPEYMKALHAAAARGQVRPLEIAPHVERAGGDDLHHQPAAEPYSQRRNFDSGVVLLNHNVHMNIESGALTERDYLGEFADWSAFHYWGWVTLGRVPGPDDARAFNRWILASLESFHQET